MCLVAWKQYLQGMVGLVGLVENTNRTVFYIERHWTGPKMQISQPVERICFCVSDRNSFLQKASII